MLCDHLEGWDREGGREGDLLENELEDTGKGKLGRSERVALTYIHYQM